jgi:spore coat protein U domain-containing protein, fimbrial subunit CupE1/2/3/6
VTPARSLVIALVAVVLLIGARPLAGVPQFPRGLMASAAPKANRSCTIETRPLSFGIYDPLAGTDLDAIGQIIYACESGSGGGPGRAKPENKGIRIEMAQGSSNSFAPRHMYGLGFADLQYNIYLDATHRTVWGTGEGSTQVYIDEHPPNGTPVIVPAFGRIFGRQDVAAGPYTDNVPVRIVF